MRILAALVLTGSLLSAGCTTPDGRPDPGATAGLAVGLAAIGGLAYLAAQSDDGPRRGYGRGNGHDGYRGGYRGGRGRGW